MKILFLLSFLLSHSLLARDALYTVPVPSDRSDLMPYAESQAENVKFEQKKDKLRLEYKLPLILTGGVEKKIRLESQAITNYEKVVLDGEGAMGICTSSESVADRYDCELSYERDKLQLDKQAIDAFISSETYSPADLTPRLEVGEIFFNEARGILHALVLKQKIKVD